MSTPTYGSTPQSQAQVLPDEPEDEGQDIVIETDDLSSLVGEETDATVPAAEPVPAVDDEIPEPLRGKSQKELAKMYAEAQKVIGRQGQEVGEVRRLADGLIKQGLNERARREATAALAPAKPAADEGDRDLEFFSKPQDAVRRAIAEHPDLKTLKNAAAQAVARERNATAKANLTEFQTSYPDAGETLADEKFREWIEASKVRKALLHRAHTAYDLDAAHEVFGTWNQLKAAKAPPVPTGAQKKAAATAQRKAVSAAAVPTGNAGASEERGSKKIYNRIDMMRLMENDPERYEALSGEIQKAYAEGRVR